MRDFIAEATAISGIGIAVVLVASVRLIFVVEGVFNAVWGAPRRRMSVRRVAIYSFALLALGLVLGGIGARPSAPCGASTLSTPPRRPLRWPPRPSC